MLKILKIKEVRWEPDYYPRDSFDSGTAKSYAKAMKMGERFPSIIVALIDGAYYLVDGLHRLKAHEINGKDHVQALVNKDVKTLRDLYIEAVKLNTKHGRTLTGKDKEAIIKKLKELEVEEAEITKLILAPISDFKPINYGKFRRSVGVRRSRRWNRGGPTHTPIESSDDFSADTLFSAIDSVLSCIRKIDFSSLDDHVLRKIRSRLQKITSESCSISSLSGDELNKESRDTDIGATMEGMEDEDEDVDDFETESPTKPCSVCGMNKVSGEGHICDACDSNFPKID